MDGADILRFVRDASKWIRRLRDHLGVNQQELAASLGVAQASVSRWEKGNFQPNGKQWIALNDLASRHGFPQFHQAARVPVVGYVGAGGEMHQSIDDLAMGGSLEEDGAEAPPGSGPDTVALIVRGESMWPAYGEGDLLFYDDVREGDLEALIGRECVVRVADGRTFVKRLTKGSEPRLWTLLSYNAPPMTDIPVLWAAKVKWVEKR